MKHSLILATILMLLLGCKDNKSVMTPKHTNSLIKETSPYLLQHAHNPVNWEAWHAEVIEKAQKEDKLLLISIGYAACHWCHVMEKECFEDEEVAEVMNSHFVNIKIDREERPDIDQIYMDAIQLMTGHGGWPLNIIALPDGRPFWGATYVPKEKWMNTIKQISDLYKSDPIKAITYADNLSRGIRQINLIENNEEADTFKIEELDKAVTIWSSYFDTFLGGYKRAPKFMMPNNLEFLLHYAVSQKNKSVLEYVNTTLTRMAYGGIYDHVGGGFSRYAVDTKWHVPHFEKMLYDNGQLISLYSKAYAHTKNPLYKKVVEETVQFIQEELTDASGGFYASLDADSLDTEGTLKEGAYYVWTEKQLKKLLETDFELFADYYNINSYGLWEEGEYILIRDDNTEEILRKYQISEIDLTKRINACLSFLKRERTKRNKPRLDDKILTSWNALLLSGLIDAYRYFGDEIYLQLALKNAQFLKENMLRNDGSLFRNHKNGKSTISGFLEDYATLIEAYLSLYQVTFDAQWLTTAKSLLDYCLVHFKDEKSQLFYFTSDQEDPLIRRTIETNDNVISSSNSIMAKNLFKFSKLYPEAGYETSVKKMVRNMQPYFKEHGQGYANWLHLVLFEQLHFFEVAVIGADAIKNAQEISRNYLPNCIFAAAEKEGEISLLKNRYQKDKTQIFICIDGSCKLPLTSTLVAIEELKPN